MCYSPFKCTDMHFLPVTTALQIGSVQNNRDVIIAKCCPHLFVVYNYKSLRIIISGQQRIQSFLIKLEINFISPLQLFKGRKELMPLQICCLTLSKVHITPSERRFGLLFLLQLLHSAQKTVRFVRAQRLTQHDGLETLLVPVPTGLKLASQHPGAMRSTPTPVSSVQASPITPLF